MRFFVVRARAALVVGLATAAASAVRAALAALEDELGVERARVAGEAALGVAQDELGLGVDGREPDRRCARTSARARESDYAESDGSDGVPAAHPRTLSQVGERAGAGPRAAQLRARFRAMKNLTYLALVLAVASCGGDDDHVPPSDGGATDSGVATDSGPVGTDAGTDGGGTTIDGGASSDTWGSFAMGFFATYCVECHAGPPSGRDYQTIDDVQRDAAIIRCGTAPASEPSSDCGATPAAGQFPVGSGPFPSDEDRRRLVAWIDAGLPE